MGSGDLVQGGGAVQGARYHDEERGLEHVGTVRGAGQDGVTQGAGHDGTVQGAEHTKNVRGARQKVWDRVLSPSVPVNSTLKLHLLISSANKGKNLPCTKYYARGCNTRCGTLWCSTVCKTL